MNNTNIFEYFPYVFAFVLAWLVAHLMKYIIGRLKSEHHSLSDYVFMSGGMPSSHSATVISLLTVIAWRDGIGSGLFGLALLISLIVMYDAVKVRRSVGEQGEALRQVIAKLDCKSIKQPYLAMGHLPVEILVGAGLGLVIGLIVIFLTTL